MFKKIVSAFLVLTFAFSLTTFAEEETTYPVEIKASAAVLMDSQTGKILMEKNANEPMHPASLTKIMTILLVVEAIDSQKIALTDMVTVSENASNKGGSQIWLEVGEQMSVDDLLKATIVGSANDASAALAEHIAGSEPAFVEMMNQRAAQLSMTKTVFENCTGLDDNTVNHITTANDIALMAREVLKHEKVFDYTNIWMDTLRGGETELTNTNKLIKSFEGITGLKTGTTSKAGYCVCATALREDMHLVAVVLDGDDTKARFATASDMLNWGFANYMMVMPEIDYSQIVPIKVINGQQQFVMPQAEPLKPALVTRTTLESAEQKVELPEDIKAPVENGQLVGSVKYSIDGVVVSESKIYVNEEVKVMDFTSAYHKMWSILVTN